MARVPDPGHDSILALPPLAYRVTLYAIATREGGQDFNWEDDDAPLCSLRVQFCVSSLYMS